MSRGDQSSLTVSRDDHGNSFNDDQGSEPAKKKTACIGILIFGVIVVVALVMVGVKEATHQQKDMIVSSDKLEATNNLPLGNTSGQIGNDTSNQTDVPVTVLELEDENTTQFNQTDVLEIENTTHSDIEVTSEQGIENTTHSDIEDTSDQGIENATDSEIRETTIFVNDETDTLDKGVSEPVVGVEPQLDETETTFIGSMTKLFIDDLVEGNITVEESTADISGRSFSGTSRKVESEAVTSCGQNMFRCRNGEKCIYGSQRCDKIVDCEDYSDEDDCSCVDRLDEERFKCDGYDDCPNGEDESECGCPSGQRFCQKEKVRNEFLKTPTCRADHLWCDGYDDCPNGKDEEGCLILVDETIKSPVSFLNASSACGVLMAKSDSEWLPVGLLEEHKSRSMVEKFAAKACEGIDSEARFSFREMPSSMREGEVMTVEYFDDKAERWRFKKSRLVGETDKVSVVDVECGNSYCRKSRRKRDHSHNVDREKCIHKTNRGTEEEIEKCMEELQGTRIVGGTSSKTGSWPYIVSLYIEADGVCGATIIQDNWILTAAHCFKNTFSEVKRFYFIRAGMPRRNSQSSWEQVRMIEKVVIHSEYNMHTMRHDIAVAKLVTPLNINKFVKPMNLPPHTPTVDSNCIAAGWGMTSEGGELSLELMEVKIPVWRDCGYYVEKKPWVICGGYQEGGKDSCQGDSGGPLFCEKIERGKRGTDDSWYLGGIVSHGHGCARKGEPGVYVKVSYYLDWIKDAISEKFLPTIQPSSSCPGLTCSRSNCIPQEYVCDDVVDCLNGDDTRYCITLQNGTKVQAPPEEVSSSELAKSSPSTEDPVGDKFSELDVEISTCQSIESALTLHHESSANSQISCAIFRNIVTKFKNKFYVFTEQYTSAKVEDRVINSLDKVLVFLRKYIDSMTAKFDSLVNISGRSSAGVDRQVSDEPVGRTSCGADEFQCRDGSRCLKSYFKCNGRVECGDFSDEDACSCLDRLDQDRFCDGYDDCLEGEDELDCGCPDGESFCEILVSSNGRSKTKECVETSRWCNGVRDCENGKDEEGCLILVEEDLAHFLNVTPANARSYGWLMAKSGQGWLPLGLPITTPQETIGKLTKAACEEAGADATSINGSLTENPTNYQHMVTLHVDPANDAWFMSNNSVTTTSSPLHMVLVECDNLDRSKSGEELMGDKNYDARIVGGKDANTTSWPYIVALYFNGELSCGATVISPSWAITAAHCIRPPPIHMQIRAGMKRTGSQSIWEQVRNIATAIKHPEYDSNFLYHDVALVKVDKPLNLNKYIQPINLPFDALMSPRPGSTCTAAGWGLLSEGGRKANALQEVDIPIFEDCKHWYNNIEYQICGGYAAGRMDACQGDSGGPLFCKTDDIWYLGGVISHGTGCARPDEPGVYVRVAFYLDWISKMTRDEADHSGVSTVIVTDCPGLTCFRGGCIPFSFVCDNIVDCLEGDDITCYSNGTRRISPSSSATVSAVNHVVEISPLSIEVSSVPAQDPMSEKLEELMSELLRCQSLESDVALNDVPLSNSGMSCSTFKNIVTQFDDLYKQGKFKHREDHFLVLLNQVMNYLKKFIDWVKIKLEKSVNILARSSVVEDRKSGLELWHHEDPIKKKLDELGMEIIRCQSIENALGLQGINLSNSSISCSVFESIVTQLDKKYKEMYKTEELRGHILALLDQVMQYPKKYIILVRNKLDNEVNTLARSFTDEDGETDDDTGQAGIVPWEANSCATADNMFECRDGSRCMKKQHKCNGKVECGDFSDEANCSCIDKLDQERLCDGYDDCLGGEDEFDCGCPFGESFCQVLTSNNGRSKTKECVETSRWCDGVKDCKNGKDEEGCLILVEEDITEFLNVTPSSAGSCGLLMAKSGQGWLPLVLPETIPDETVRRLAGAACDGVAPNATTVKGRLEESPVNYKYMVGLDTVSDTWNFNNQSSALTNTKLDMVYVECGNIECDKSRRKRSVDFDARIVGGVAANVTSWPYIVALYFNGELSCGATIISASWIITASHCIRPPPIHMQIRAGMKRTVSQNIWEQVRNIATAIKHPEYDSKFLRHDVALAKLDRPLNINQFVQPISLPFNASMSPSPNSTCTAAGWGSLSEHGEKAKELRQVEIPILKKCKRSYNNIEYQICGGYEAGKKDSCQGDSGGPLFCKVDENYYLGGVISHGRGCARPDEPGVYVRVAYYLDWIRETVGSQNFSSVSTSVVTSCQGLQCSRSICIPSIFVCDNLVDCVEGDDVACYPNRTRISTRIIQTELIVKEVLNPVVFFNTTTEQPDFITTSTETVVRNIIFKKNYKTCGSGEFQCLDVMQCVQASDVCNNVADCIDMSDERHCTCGDYLSHSANHPSPVCDGFLHCADGSDEEDCDCHKAGHFKCWMSTNNPKCILGIMECDGNLDCDYGEDERNCVALSETSTILLGDESKELIIRPTGALAIKKKAEWHPICVPVFASQVASHVCKYVGYRGPDGLGFNYIPKDEGPFTGRDTLEEGPESRGTPCKYVNITCKDERCGKRDLWKNTLYSPKDRDIGAWPWTANVFVDGEYSCGATLIHDQFVVTSRECSRTFSSVFNKLRHVTVLLGQPSLTSMKGKEEQLIGTSPHANIRRVVAVKNLPNTQIALGKLDRPAILTDYIGKLCVSTISWLPTSLCVISGKVGHDLSVGHKVKLSKADGDKIIPCGHKLYLNHPRCQPLSTWSYPTHNTTSWSGALACPDRSGQHFAMGIYYSTGDNWGSLSFESLVTVSARESIDGLIRSMMKNSTKVPRDICQQPRYRCSLGRCLSEQKVCNGEWDCEDGSDEVNCKSLPLCEVSGMNDNTCTCDPRHGKCANNLCIHEDKFCDGVDDCGDGSDEGEDCGKCIGKLIFHSPDKVCDGRLDCNNGEDEMGCDCPESFFKCSTLQGSSDSDTCIKSSSLCDGRRDCLDGVDEIQCVNIDMNGANHVDDSSVSPQIPIASSSDLRLQPIPDKKGYLKVRLFGNWYLYCTHDWSSSKSDSTCQKLGYSNSSTYNMFAPKNEVSNLEDSPREEENECKVIKISCTRLKS